MATITKTNKRKKTILDRINPIPWLKRSLTFNVGSLSTPDGWIGWMFGTNKANVNVNETSALGVPPYFRAESIIAQLIASLPKGIFRKDQNGTFEIKSHSLAKLLAFRPHPLYSTFTFFETITRHAIRRGNAYVLIGRDGRGGVNRLTILNHTGKVEPFLGKDGNFWYKFPGSGIYRHDEILHIKGMSFDGITGESIIKLHREVFAAQIAQIEFTSSHFGNGGHYSGLLIPEKPLTPDQKKDLRESFNSKDNSPGETGVLPHGVKYEKISSTISDQQIVAMRQQGVEDMANITGVPTRLLSGQTKANTNSEQDLRAFVIYTLRSWCKNIEDEFNSKIFPTGEQGKIFFKCDIKGLLEGDTEARAKFYMAMRQSLAISPNEIRVNEDMNPVEGLDDPKLPLASNLKEVETETAENANEGNI